MGSFALCSPCQEGATCLGGSAHPVGGPGDFARCPIAGSCGVDRACASGYKAGSFMCKDREDGYHRRSSGECEKCPSRATGMVVLFLVMLVVCSLVAFGVAVMGVRSAARAAKSS